MSRELKVALEGEVQRLRKKRMAALYELDTRHTKEVFCIVRQHGIYLIRSEQSEAFAYLFVFI